MNPTPPGRPRLSRIAQAAGNALEILRLGRLAPREGARYDVVHGDRHYRLRRYEVAPAGASRPPILLVPPLMLTAEIYDVAPDLSAVNLLGALGADAWVVDFGAPEREEGGMSRTLDDHVRAVADAVGRVREATGRDVHLAGYSQGGMFAYQATAYLGSAGVASVITFGSPVDIHKNLPNVSTDVAARMIQAVRPLVEPQLARIEGLPGVLTSTGFKLLSVRRELAQLVDFVQKLHDRQALLRRETRRRFLAGEGFVAWPGPALRQFVDEFIVHNRMLSGGFVIDGRTVTLAFVRCPVLYFVGTRDEIARAPAVRAIARAAPNAETFAVDLPAGHFGLVVGGAATRETWPTVVAWMRWRDGEGPRPALLPARGRPRDDEDEEAENAAIVGSIELELFYDVLKAMAASAWNKIGESFVDLGDTIDDLRWQLPRLAELRRMQDDTPVSVGRALAEQARAIPERTFFLWSGRAFTYADASLRVDNVVRGLVACGVRPGDRVGVLMEGRPSYLTMVTALNRLGAVSVLMSPRLDAGSLQAALALEPLRCVAADPENAARARAAFAGEVLVLGGGPRRALAPGVVDMEAIDPASVSLPDGHRQDPGRAGDLATIIVTIGERGRLRAARITNGRWALSALGAAAACTLTSNDTVYCCLPLHHPAGLLVSVGGALVGGSRLALATRFEAGVFWSEVRSYGATVVFYAGEMCRDLVSAPITPAERRSSLRLFAGSGLRAGVWRQLVDRFGAGVLEFYGSTEGALVLANAAGEKIGALGRPLPGSTEVELVAWDFDRGQVARDPVGRAVRSGAGEPGVMIARLEAASSAASSERVIRDVFFPGDAWLATADLVRRDVDGDHWLVDRLADVIRTAKGPVPGRPVEDTLYELPEVARAVVYGVRLPSEEAEVPVAAVVLRAGAELDRAELYRRVEASHAEAARPRFVRVVEAIAMTEGYRPLKGELRAEGVRADGRTWVLDAERGAYVPLDASG